MNAEGPIRFIMVGGFLGAGKTTALLRLARHYTALGLRVGIITNDQAEGLVDTLAFRDAGFTTEEIPAGCFCCHFDKLLEASGRLADGHRPDIILAEPVGSCTDLVNAVITPLRAVYTDDFDVAPYIVLLDPHRALDALAASGPTGFSTKITYLYKMQQNEADIIVINKADTLSAAELDAVNVLVAQNFPQATVVVASALTGAGFDQIGPLLDNGKTTVGRNPIDVDYARYTEAELALGWLNAAIGLEAATPWDGNAFLHALAKSVRKGLIDRNGHIAHFKMRLIDGHKREAALHTTRDEEAGILTRALRDPLAEGALVINLRAEAPPEALKESVDEALAATCSDRGLAFRVERCSAFAPSPPVPPPLERSQPRIPE